MKKIVLLFLFLNALISCGHQLNSEVENSINIITEKNNIYGDSFWIRREDSYVNFLRVSTIDDLVYLTNHENQRIRYYAFSGLVDKNYPKIKEIFFKHEHDTAEIYMSDRSCIKNFYNVNVLMLLELNPKDSEFKYCFTQAAYEKIYDKITK